MSDIIKVGIIGSGFGQRIHIPGFKNVPGYEVTAIAGHNYEKTIKIAKELNIPNVYDDWQKLTEDPEINLISIVTPPYWHHAMAINAIENGKNILCEKPMAMNLEQAYDMWDELESADVVGMINHEFRQIPSRMYCKELIQNGTLGQIYSVKIQSISSSRLPYSGRSWNWWASEAFGGGLWGAMGSHFIDYIRWAIGDFTGIYGRISTNVKTRKDPITSQTRKVTSDDTYYAIFTLENGAEGILEGSVTYHGKGGTKIEIQGSEGAILIDSEEQIFQTKDNNEWQLLQIPDEYKFRPLKENETYALAAFERLLEHLRQGIQSHESPTPSFEDGFEVQKVLDALKESYIEKKWINIP